MEHYVKKVMETTEFLKSKLRTSPEIGLLTGTGLGEIAETLDPEVSFDYREIPNFPIPTVESHIGRLVSGKTAGRHIIALQGRFHLYEGYSSREISFPIRIMQQLGVRTLFLSNAAGGLNPGFRAGDIMLVSDHVNLTGENALIGPNEDRWGMRFPEMINAYDKTLSENAQKAGVEIGVKLQKGVYAGLKGPSLETPAEVRFLRIIGADAVGFSTVQEVITAVHSGMKVLGLSIITNVLDPDRPVSVSLESILEVAERAAPKVRTILKRVVQYLDVPSGR
jgi:purine-nucleoside phosphorylase